MAALLLAACGSPRVSGSPPTFTDKSTLDGEWWYLATIEAVDGELLGRSGIHDVTAPWLGALLHGDGRTDAPVLARIRWEITEDYLLGHRVGDEGDPVVAFSIEAHFDDPDRIDNRPWFERSSMRVDWSTQLITSTGVFGPGLATLESVRHWSREPVAWFLPIERDRPSPRGRTDDGYLERVTSELWTPDRNGESLRVQIRHRFLRVPEDHEPASAMLTDDELGEFGIFRTDSGMRFRRSTSGEPMRFVLSEEYPLYLRRGAFEAVAEWNEAMMRARRAVDGRPAPSSSEYISCQSADPTRPCYCLGSVVAPDVLEGSSCSRADTDWFVLPDRRGQTDPYGCWIEGPSEPRRFRTFRSYGSAFQSFRFEGSECAIVLAINPCDRGPYECDEGGDPRHAVIHFADDLPVCGVAQPRMDPTTGEGLGGVFHVGGACLQRLAGVSVGLESVLRDEDLEGWELVPPATPGYYRWLRASLEGDEAIPIPPSYETRIVLPRLWDVGRDDEARRLLIGSDVEAIFDGLELDVWARLSYDDPHTYPRYLRHDDGVDVSDSTSTFADGPLRVAREADARQRTLAEHLVFDRRWGHFAAGPHEYWARALDAPDAFLLWMQMLHRAMVARLVGHALGLTPNLAASLDREHFSASYARIDEAEPLPTLREFDLDRDDRTLWTEADLHRRAYRRARRARHLLGVGHVSGASVLDVHGDLSDLSGVGAYDQAAVLYSYFDLRETPDGFLRAFRGGETCASDEDCPFGPGGAPLPDGQELQRCFESACSPWDHEYPAVERYASCQPHDIDDSACLPLDAGATFLEAVHHFRDRWEELHPWTHDVLDYRGRPPPSVTPIAVAALMRISSRVWFEDLFPSWGPLAEVDRRDATREGFAWLVELLTRPAAGEYAREEGRDVLVGVTPGGEGAWVPFYREGTVLADDNLWLIGLGYERLVAINTLTARTFDDARQLSFFDHFEHSRPGVLHALVTDHPERFGPRLWGRPESVHVHFPDPRIEWTRDAVTGGRAVWGARVDETYGPPAVGYFQVRALAAIHAFTEAPPFADGTRRAWVWLLGGDDAWVFPGAAPCAYGQSLPGTTDPLCDADAADYAVYERSAGYSYAASAQSVSPLGRAATGLPEPGYELLVELIDWQRRLRELRPIRDPTPAERIERERLANRILRSEAMLTLLTRVQQLLGVETWLPP